MKNTECVAFLQWALPQLGMRWPGFRKARRQVCRRIGRRLCELGLPDVAAYRACLEQNPAEWQVLDSACRITISRFYRDRNVFESLQNAVLPVLARAAIERGASDTRLARWSSASTNHSPSIALAFAHGMAPAAHTGVSRLVESIVQQTGYAGTHPCYVSTSLPYSESHLRMSSRRIRPLSSPSSITGS
jgi:hypothetical protein